MRLLRRLVSLSHARRGANVGAQARLYSCVIRLRASQSGGTADVPHHGFIGSLGVERQVGLNIDARSPGIPADSPRRSNRFRTADYQECDARGDRGTWRFSGRRSRWIDDADAVTKINRRGVRILPDGGVDIRLHRIDQFVRRATRCRRFAASYGCLASASSTNGNRQVAEGLGNCARATTAPVAAEDFPVGILREGRCEHQSSQYAHAARRWC